VHTARRLTAVAAITAAALVGSLTGTASAHVTVNAPGATQGGYTKMTFRMPTERDVASIQLEVAFPTEHPLPSARVKPQAGWTYEIVNEPLDQPLELHGREVTERVARIIWKATGPGVGATEFAEFEVSTGPLPAADRLVIPALQTYADGEVVRWIEEPVEGAEEPEHPAPVLGLAAGEDEDAAQGGAAVATDLAASESDAGSGLAVAALVVAGLALLTAIGSFFRGRRAA
jgi:uncharacterized protein YcnI